MCNSTASYVFFRMFLFFCVFLKILSNRYRYIYSRSLVPLRKWKFFYFFNLLLFSESILIFRISHFLIKHNEVLNVTNRWWNRCFKIFFFFLIFWSFHIVSLIETPMKKVIQDIGIKARGKLLFNSPVIDTFFITAP